MLLKGQKLSGFVSKENTVSKPLLGYRLAFMHAGYQSLQETQCSQEHNQHRIEGCSTSNQHSSEENHFPHATGETDAQGSQWCVSSSLLRSAAKEEPRSFPATECRWSLGRKVLPGPSLPPVSSMCARDWGCAVSQEPPSNGRKTQGCSPAEPPPFWGPISDATRHCATRWPQLIVGQASESKSMLLARIGTRQAILKVLFWDVVCVYRLPLSLLGDANNSLLVLFFLFHLVTSYFSLFGLTAAFLSAAIQLNSTEPGHKSCLMVIHTTDLLAKQCQVLSRGQHKPGIIANKLHEQG